MRDGNVRMALDELFRVSPSSRNALPKRNRRADGVKLIRRSSQKIANDAIIEFVRVLDT